MAFKHRYFAPWYGTDAAGNSRLLYAAGVLLDPTDETTLHVAQGHAEAVEVPDEPAPAPDASTADAPAPEAAPAPAAGTDAQG